MNTSAKTRSFLSLLAILIVGSAVEKSNAALIIDFMENASGTTHIRLTGTGTITANGGDGSLINIATVGDTFVVNGTPSTNDFTVSPTINLGPGFASTRISVTDDNGFVGSSGVPAGLNSRVLFGWTSSSPYGTFYTGNQASDLNGTYASTLPFSLFVVGSYSGMLTHTSHTAALTDIGEITINVIPYTVPEPATSVLLLGGGAFALVFGRRRVWAREVSLKNVVATRVC